MDANTLQTVLANLISKYGEGAAKHGPDAVGLLIRYLHYMAIMTLCFGAVWVAISYLSSRGAKHVWKKWSNHKACDEYWDFDKDMPYGCWLIVMVFFTVTSAIGAGICLFDPGTWLSALDSRMVLVQIAQAAD